MKRYFSQFVTLSISVSCSIAYIHAVQPIWNIGFDTYKKAETVESKICALEIVIEQDFSETFTAIQEVLDKICIVKSVVDVVDENVTSLLDASETVLSQVSQIDQEIIDIENTIEIIRVDDFGGTWTALDELENILCDKIESTFEVLSTIESSIDKLTSDNLDQFIATFTKLEVLASEVLDTMTLVQEFADQLENELEDINSLIDIIKIQFGSIDSKIELLDITITQGFIGTFTVIDAIEQKLCLSDQSVESIEDIIMFDQVGTFTFLDAIELKLCDASMQLFDISDIWQQIKNKVQDIQN